MTAEIACGIRYDFGCTATIFGEEDSSPSKSLTRTQIFSQEDRKIGRLGGATLFAILRCDGAVNERARRERRCVLAPKLLVFRSFDLPVKKSGDSRRRYVVGK
jgi:hypothetical protein